MKRLVQIAWLLAFSVFLGGCETLSKSECAVADWRGLGVQDGLQGRVDTAADYYESCTKHGYSVDVNSYRAGRQEGLRQYCRYDNAVRVGLAGKSYLGVCAPNIDVDFRRLQSAGYRVYEAERRLDKLKAEQRGLERDLSDKETPPAQKPKIRSRLAQLDGELNDARDELGYARSKLDRLWDSYR
ncbi:MAG: DUF2799 domain-containing protein [Sulfuriferula sp.]|nr:DUF2799 domain-containing protein [Sulfuriferula sp.]